MNNAKRKKLNQAMDHLNQAICITEEVRDQEESDMDNLPESLHDSEKYEIMDAAVNSLEDAISSMEDAIENIEAATG